MTPLAQVCSSARKTNLIAFPHIPPLLQLVYLLMLYCSNNIHASFLSISLLVNEGSGVVRALERVLETETKGTSGSGSGNGSGSGRTGSDMHSGSLAAEKDDTARLRRLQDFQVQVIAKAMSFPAAEYISYSTCSVHNVRLMYLTDYTTVARFCTIPQCHTTTLHQLLTAYIYLSDIYTMWLPCALMTPPTNCIHPSTGRK